MHCRSWAAQQLQPLLAHSSLPTALLTCCRQATVHAGGHVLHRSRMRTKLAGICSVQV